MRLAIDKIFHIMMMAVTATAAVAGEPVARVGNRAISAATLAEAVRLAANSQYYHRDLSPERQRTIEREQLESLVRRQLNILGGYDRGLVPQISRARREVTGIESSLGKAEYERSLKIHGMTREDHARILAETLLGEEAYSKFVLQPSTVSDADVKAAYDTDPSRWRMPEAQRIEHILVTVPLEALAHEVADREREVADLIRRLKAGEPFADLASKHSDDLYRIKGGDLGWVHRSRLEEPLESASWNAVVGEIVGPLRGADGFHVFRVAERRPPRQLTLVEAAPNLRKELEKQRLTVAEERWFAEVRSRHAVEILRADLREGAK
jgi:parvulin-like peptidyl-prolyl isomerase